MERYTQRNFRNYLIADGQWDLAYIKFPADQRTIQIDHSAREYELRSGVRGGNPVWDPADRDCSKLARAFLLSDLKRVGETYILGVRSIEYTGLRSRTERKYVWLAPSLGCTQMKIIDYDHNWLGLPSLYFRSEVVSVQIGEPDAELFKAPSQYRKIR